MKEENIDKRLADMYKQGRFDNEMENSLTPREKTFIIIIITLQFVIGFVGGVLITLITI